MCSKNNFSFKVRFVYAIAVFIVKSWDTEDPSQSHHSETAFIDKPYVSFSLFFLNLPLESEEIGGKLLQSSMPQLHRLGKEIIYTERKKETILD